MATMTSAATVGSRGAGMARNDDRACGQANRTLSKLKDCPVGTAPASARHEGPADGLDTAACPGKHRAHLIVYRVKYTIREMYT